MPRARSDVDDIDVDLTNALRTLREKLYLPDGSEQELALCAVETFCAVALRVMRKTNPSKLRSEARNVELQCRLDNVPVLRGAA